MPDFPGICATPQRTVISTFGPNGLFGDASMAQQLVTTAGAVWPAANRALYSAVWVEEPCVIRRIACRVTVQSGNLDMGIYDSRGNRIVSKGSTAVAAAVTQIIDLTASVTGTASPLLNPGMYYLALNVDNTTAAFCSSTLTSAELCRVCGIQQQAVGAVTLPATATFANPASAYAPLVVMYSGTTL